MGIHAKAPLVLHTEAHCRCSPRGQWAHSAGDTIYNNDTFLRQSTTGDDLDLIVVFLWTIQPPGAATSDLLLQSGRDEPGKVEQPVHRMGAMHRKYCWERLRKRATENSTQGHLRWATLSDRTCSTPPYLTHSHQLRCRATARQQRPAHSKLQP